MISPSRILDNIQTKIGVNNDPIGKLEVSPVTILKDSNVKESVVDETAGGEPKIEPECTERPSTTSISNEVKDESTVKSGNVSYLSLCETFAKIEATTKRLEIASLLADFFSEVIYNSPESLIECVYLCLNRIGPDYEGKELGIGESLLVKAVASATGRTPKAIKSSMEEMGDLGLVAQSSKGKQKMVMQPKALTVHSVFENLKTIANIHGGSSQQRKIDIINKMVVACTSCEPKYLIR